MGEWERTVGDLSSDGDAERVFVSPEPVIESERMVGEVRRV